jgi:hypothetical protein
MPDQKREPQSNPPRGGQQSEGINSKRSQSSPRDYGQADDSAGKRADRDDTESVESDLDTPRAPERSDRNR